MPKTQKTVHTKDVPVQRKNIALEVLTPGASLQGRNGLAHCGKIRVSTGTYVRTGRNQELQEFQTAYIDGHSARTGKPINGGFFHLPIEAMDELCREWLKARA